MVRTHLRFAAGACVLAVGLLLGSPGGAVAVADTPSSDSAAPGDGSTKASTQQSTTARSLVGQVTDTLHETIRGITSTLGSGRPPGQRPSIGASPKKEPGGTNATGEENNPRLVAADRNADAPVSDVTAPVADVMPAVPDDVTAPVADVMPAVPNDVAPVADAVAPGPQAVKSVPNVVAPVSDVILAVQDMLTSVAGSVVPPAKVAADLLALLVPGVAGVEPVGIRSGSSDGAELSPTTGNSSLGWRSLLVPQPTGIRSVPPALNATASAPVDVVTESTFGTRVVPSPLGTAPPASNGASPRSFLHDVFGQLPLTVAASLAALAAAALPGVGGLLILAAAGARIGYRQAKVGFALHTSGVARFAGPGPIGVVRSGSLLFVRPRALRHGNFLDKAA